MAIQRLTSAFVRDARAESGKERSVYWDTALPSFGLVVTQRGAKSWCVQYRNGQISRRLTLNGVLSLEAARKEARIILGQVARGSDPVIERRRVSEASRNTLRSVCERYLTREGGKLRTTTRRQQTLARLVYPILGDRPIDDIKRSDINALLDDVEDRHGAAMADQVLAILRRIFNWHAIRDDRFRTPFVRGMGRRKPEQLERARILNDDELRAVWKTAEAFSSPWGQLIRFLLLTTCRRTEASAITYDELANGDWTIPAARYKTGNEVTLPLSKAAKKVLAEIPRFKGCRFLFTTDGQTSVSGFASFKLRFDAACGVKDWRLHDLRRTSRSLLSRAGISSDVAERCLGHVIPGVRGVYDRHRYLAEMAEAFEKLAAQIAAVVER
jgi:integrase